LLSTSEFDVNRSDYYTRNQFYSITKGVKMSSEEINKQIEEFLKKGGSIEKIPAGTSTERALSEKKKLFGLSSRRPGFDKERLILTPKD